MEEEKVEDAANDDVVEYSFTEYDAARFFDFGLAESSLEAGQAEVWFESARSYPPSQLLAEIWSFSGEIPALTATLHGARRELAREAVL